MWISGSLTRDQFNLLIAHGGYPKLADYLHAAHPGTKFIAAGQKNYAVYSSNGPTGDISVTFSGRNFDCDGDGTQQLARADRLQRAHLHLGARAAAATTSTRRRRARSLRHATTPPAWMYPLDGNRFAPGLDPAHRGGDVWTADAGMAMMENEPWSGMLLTLGSIDKASHMWGGITDTGTYPPGSDEEQAHLRVHRQDGRRAGRADDRQAARARPARRDARRAHHRPRGPAVDSLPRRQRGRPRRLQLVLRRDAERHVPGAVAVAGAADRHRQRALHLPGLGDPHVAHRHVRRREAQRREGDGDAAGRDRHAIGCDGRRYRLVDGEPARDVGARARLVGAARPGDRRHDGGAVRRRRRRACCGTTRATASRATTAARSSRCRRSRSCSRRGRRDRATRRSRCARSTSCRPSCARCASRAGPGMDGHAVSLP